MKGSLNLVASSCCRVKPASASVWMVVNADPAFECFKQFPMLRACKKLAIIKCYSEVNWAKRGFVCSYNPYIIVKIAFQEPTLTVGIA